MSDRKNQKKIFVGIDSAPYVININDKINNNNTAVSKYRSAKNF